MTVTQRMTARFDDEDVHPVYGTATLVAHMEQVSRRLLKPLLEPGEEGVGARIEVTHLAPVPVGRPVDLEATVLETGARRMRTAVVASSEGRVVARGTFEQVVVDLERWRAEAGVAAQRPPADSTSSD